MVDYLKKKKKKKWAFNSLQPSPPTLPTVQEILDIRGTKNLSYIQDEILIQENGFLQLQTNR